MIVCGRCGSQQRGTAGVVGDGYPGAPEGFRRGADALAPEYVHLSLSWSDRPFRALGTELDSPTKLLNEA